MVRILTIDDEPDVRELLARALGLVGYEVVGAQDGDEGLRELVKGPFDLVITDLYMPNRDGVEMIEAVRKRFPTTPIIAMTGKGSEMLTVVKHLGATALLAKPFTMAQLAKVVREVLTGSKPEHH